jgi:hypothetical protein
MFAKFPLCGAQSEDSADRIERKSLTDVLRQESEAKVTQGETGVSTLVTRFTPGLSTSPVLSKDTISSIIGEKSKDGVESPAHK